jgi:hypothetical protein
MKKYLFTFFALTLTLTLGSCAGSHLNQQEALPPGQAKKIHGDRSARAYAPGQQQKQDKKPNKGSTQKHLR